MSDAHVGIVAALHGELAPLVKGWQREGQFYRGSLGRVACLAVAGGMGHIAAARACVALMAAASPRALVSVGWAGAISCGVKPPNAFLIREVVDSRTGERYSSAPGQGQRLVTLDHVARPEEKRALAERYQATLVDMEAATVARLARSRDLPFLAVKAISDGYADRLPDFNRFLGADGQLRLPRLAAYAACHPQYWRPLVQLGANSRAAAGALAELLRVQVPAIF